MEEERNRYTFNIFSGHLQTDKSAKVDNLGQEQPMPTWLVGKLVNACVEVGINMIVVRQIAETRECRPVAKVYRPSRLFWLLPPPQLTFEFFRVKSQRNVVHDSLPPHRHPV